MGDWLRHWLGIGLPMILVPLVLLLLTLRWGRPAIASDYPEDIQAAMPPFTRADRIGGRMLGPLFLLTLVGACVYTTVTWLTADPSRGYLAAFGMALATFALFAGLDLLVVDWLVICRWRPKWVVIPGTEDCAGWGDYGFHLKEQLRPPGIAALIIVPAAIAGFALLLS